MHLIPQEQEETYASILIDYKKIRLKNECKVTLVKAHAEQPKLKTIEQSLRLDHSKILDYEDMFDNYDLKEKKKPINDVNFEKNE